MLLMKCQNPRPHSGQLHPPGADLGLLTGGSQSVVVIYRSSYEPGDGGGGTTQVSLYLQKG